MILDSFNDKTPEILPDGFYLCGGSLKFIFDHRIEPSTIQPEVKMNWVRTYVIADQKLYNCGSKDLPNAVPISIEDALKQFPHMLDGLERDIGCLVEKTRTLQKCLDTMGSKCRKHLEP